MFARMCLVWHVIEQIDNKQHWPRPNIGADIARRVAKFLHEFLLPHAVSFYVGELGLSDIQDRLIAVADYILARKLEQISARDIQRGDRTMRELDRRDIEKVFNHLEACGWIIDWVDNSRRGRPAGLPVGILNPLVHQRFLERGDQERLRRSELHDVILQTCAERSAQTKPTAKVAFMITKKQKQQLAGLGYSKEQIFEMKPEQAHEILNAADL